MQKVDLLDLIEVDLPKTAYEHKNKKCKKMDLTGFVKNPVDFVRDKKFTEKELKIICNYTAGLQSHRHLLVLLFFKVIDRLTIDLSMVLNLFINNNFNCTTKLYDYIPSNDQFRVLCIGIPFWEDTTQNFLDGLINTYLTQSKIDEKTCTQIIRYYAARSVGSKELSIKLINRMINEGITPHNRTFAPMLTNTNTISDLIDIRWHVTEYCNSSPNIAFYEEFFTKWFATAAAAASAASAATVTAATTDTTDATDATMVVSEPAASAAAEAAAEPAAIAATMTAAIAAAMTTNEFLVSELSKQLLHEFDFQRVSKQTQRYIPYDFRELSEKPTAVKPIDLMTYEERCAAADREVEAFEYSIENWRDYAFTHFLGVWRKYGLI